MQRFAIYFIPADHTPLWRFGCAVLGFDAARFTDVAYPDHPLFAEPMAAAYTAAPRRYGFHATLKAPFRLAPGRSAGDLEARLEAFARARAPVETRLKLGLHRDFLALVPAAPAPGLDRLAEDCVRDFDALRAPLTAAERERRRPERLTARQRENLETWGYPYVMDEFRFHMTLTGHLDTGDRIRVQPVIEDLFSLVPPEVAVDGLALFVQDEPEGRFRVRRRFSLSGSG